MSNAYVTVERRLGATLKSVPEGSIRLTTLGSATPWHVDRLGRYQILAGRDDYADGFIVATDLCIESRLRIIDLEARSAPTRIQEQTLFQFFRGGLKSW
jgi:hypothetical protein